MEGIREHDNSRGSWGLFGFRIGEIIDAFLGRFGEKKKLLNVKSLTVLHRRPPNYDAFF